MKNSVCLFLLALFAITNLGECHIKCYVCDSKTNPHCEQPNKYNMEAHECLPNNLPDMKADPGIIKLTSYFNVELEEINSGTPLSCIKVVSKVGEGQIVVRGCQLPTNQLDFCDKLLQEGKDIVKHCSICNEDKCNGE